jgi:hypothetical protein
VNVVANATTDVVIDINGYYAAPTDVKGDTALGTGALNSDTSGANNTAFGYFALEANTTGVDNTAVGRLALAANTTGTDNTAVGYEALQNTIGPPLANPILGTDNTALGSMALAANTLGLGNTAIGAMAVENAGADQNFNTAVGYSALRQTTGDENVALGFGAGAGLTSGSNNIMIANAGMSSDNSTIRIGDPQTSTYIAGISGVTVSGGTPVVINLNGQLGVETSSRRYKEDIQNMGEASNGLLKLRPVTFHYKKPDPDGTKPLEYGLIAEEVADVYPDLVVRGQDGQIESVQYQKLPAMLLNELQKQYRNAEQQARHADEQDRRAQQQDETIKKLEARLAALEAQSSTTARVTSDKPSPSAGER